MLRGISIHIGVNRPAAAEQPTLAASETAAFLTAELAFQAGYQDIHLLRGPKATCGAVKSRIGDAAAALRPRETLFVSFSGHGTRQPDLDGDEPDGYDETWCLHDANLVDDELAECWRMAPAGARILLVAESCYAGGSGRTWAELVAEYAARARPAFAAPVYRSAMRGVQQSALATSCIASPPRNDDGIKASVLMLAAAAENQRAREGLYTYHLLKAWDGGAFQGTFCELHRRLYDRVKHETADQDPQILMLGAADPDFPLDVAFHLDRPVMRGGWDRG